MTLFATRQVAGFAMVLLIAGCAADPTQTPPAPPPTSAAPVATPPDRFVADVLDTPGLTSSVPRADLITQGQLICDAIPTTTRENLVKQLGSTKYGPAVADVLVTAAESNLCPSARYQPPPADVRLILSVTSVRGDFGGYIVNDHTGPAKQTTFNVDRAGKWTKTITVPDNSMVKLDIARIGARCEIRLADTNQLLIEDENSCIVGS